MLQNKLISRTVPYDTINSGEDRAEMTWHAHTDLTHMHKKSIYLWESQGMKWQPRATITHLPMPWS